MSELPVTYDMNSRKDSEGLNSDILEGKSINILISLLDGAKTPSQLAKELSISIVSVQLYLKKLLTINFVKICNKEIVENRVEYYYSLTSSNLEILNSIKQTSNHNVDEKISTEHFVKLTKDMLRNVYAFNDRPHKAKAYFIKADDTVMKEFKKELDELFRKYQQLEDKESVSTYGFVSLLAPYENMND